MNHFNPIFSKKTSEWWNHKFPRINALLLTLVIFPIFIIPSLPKEYTSYLYPPFFTGIFLCSAFSIHTYRKLVVYFAALLTFLFWIAYLGNNLELKVIIRCMQILFFFFMVTALVREISATPTVSITVIIDAIAAYLLLGFAFSLLVTIVWQFIPGSYNIAESKVFETNDFDPVRQNIYYTFITFTTTGYGDITPNAPIAKSLAILISISGQLYIAIILAILVGKYSSSRN